MTAGDIQNFTPLMEVLCGFNVAFALWDGFTTAITQYEVRLAEDKEEIERVLFDKKSAKDNIFIRRVLRRLHGLKVASTELTNVMRTGKICGLFVAFMNMIILAAFGVYPDLDSGLSELWWRISVTSLFVLVSLAPAAVTWFLVMWKLEKLRKDIADLTGTRAGGL